MDIVFTAVGVSKVEIGMWIQIVFIDGASAPSRLRNISGCD
jgi:hypothetical protein